MDRKIKNTIILAIVLILIVGSGSVISFIYLKNKKENKEQQIQKLKINEYDTAQLLEQLDSLKIKASKLDSILAKRKYNIPVELKQSKFFDFVTNQSANYSDNSYTNVEFVDKADGKNYSYFNYKLTGVADYNDLYKLVYAIEQSKELKKVTNAELTNLVKVDEDGVPSYLVNYTLGVRVFYAKTDRFISSNFKENNLYPGLLYDAFYPLIRKEIPPNVDNLIDVQTANLLALVSDGAFLSDGNGNTALLWEGDQVYLGYLTKIDYSGNKVHFILNKGGIIEKVVLELQREKIDKKEKKK